MGMANRDSLLPGVLLRGWDDEPNHLADTVPLLVENGLMSEEQNDFIGHTVLVIATLFVILWTAWIVLAN